MNPHIRSLSEKNKIFCSYCICSSCRNGHYGLSHALTINGNYICETCYEYDLCRCGYGEECEHKPKLISTFKEYPGHFK